jgi:hypothetical protein
VKEFIKTSLMITFVLKDHRYMNHILNNE